MKTKKRLISMILTLVLICSMFTISAGAQTISSDLAPTTKTDFSFPFFNRSETPKTTTVKVRFFSNYNGVSKYLNLDAFSSSRFNQQLAGLRITRKGYLFQGWYTSKVGGSQITATSVQNGCTKFYAHWQKVSVGASKITTATVNSRNVRLNFRAVSGAEGYQVRYSTNILMRGAKTTYASSNGVFFSVPNTGTYFFQVRAYKSDSCGNRVYGRWTTYVKKRVC